MQAKPSLLTLAANTRIGQPDRGYQITLRKHRQHPRVDLVGLARQRRQPLDLLRISDQNLPAKPLQRVVNEAGARHRLDHPAHRLAMLPDMTHKTTQAISVRRRGELLDQLPMLREQANIKTLATQIQSSMQHYVRASSGSFSVTNGACHRGGPPSSHSKASVSATRKHPARVSGLGYEVEAVVEREFEVFGEPVSFGRPYIVEMVGQLNALRLRGRRDLRGV